LEVEERETVCVWWTLCVLGSAAPTAVGGVSGLLGEVLIASIVMVWFVIVEGVVADCEAVIWVGIKPWAFMA
jgi:hypothetical protein